MRVPKRHIGGGNRLAVEVGGTHRNRFVGEAGAADGLKVRDGTNQSRTWRHAIVIGEIVKRLQLAGFRALPIVQVQKEEIIPFGAGDGGGDTRIHAAGNKDNGFVGLCLIHGMIVPRPRALRQGRALPFSTTAIPGTIIPAPLPLRKECPKAMSRISIPTLLLLLPVPLSAQAPVPYEREITPGTPAEFHHLKKNSGGVLTSGGVRHAEAGGFWFYTFSAAPGSLMRLRITLETAALPAVMVLAPGNQPLPVSVTRLQDGTLSLQWTAPASLQRGGEILVGLSGKPAAFGVKRLRYLRLDPDRDHDGLPDSVKALLLENTPPGTRLTLTRPSAPSIFVKTERPPSPAHDFGSDGVLVSSPLTSLWHGRGASVWARNEALSLPNEADRSSFQTDFRGDTPLLNGLPVPSPTPARFASERRQLAENLAAGADGVLLSEPFYFARAGHEPVFKAAWEKIYASPWKAPESGMEPRWLAGRLMSNLLTTYTAGLSQELSRLKPGVKRVLLVPNPLSAAKRAEISPVFRLISLPAVADVLSEADPGEAKEAQLRYLGAERSLPFSYAYLKASVLDQILRGTGKRLTLTLPAPGTGGNLFSGDLAEALTASLLFPDLRRFVLPDPESRNKLSADGKTQFASLLSLLTELAQETRFSGPAQPDNGDEIGVLLSETAQWQREIPFPSDLDGLYGLAVPLLQRGVPVQMASLDRADNPDYLKAFKTLLLSYDFQKPLDEKLQIGLAQWVKRGGSLIFVGGSDPYNQIGAGWWQKAKRASPQEALFALLGIETGTAVTQLGEAEDPSRYLPVAQGEAGEGEGVQVDLTRFAASYGSAAVRLSPLSSESGLSLREAELIVGGKPAAAFRSGSDLENRFVRFENGTVLTSSGERTFGGNAALTFQFDNLPPDTTLFLKLALRGSYRLEAATAKPDETHVLIGEKRGGDLPASLPKLRVGADYPLTFYPAFPPPPAEKSGRDEERNTEPASLYTLRTGGTPVWAQEVEKGTVIFVGAAPAYFSSSERSAALLRGLVEYAHQRAGAKYSEPGSLLLRRGRFAVVKTFGEELTLEGRSVDVLSPELSVAADRVIPPFSLGIYALLETRKKSGGETLSIPRLGFVSGQVNARVETPRSTVYFVRGAQGSVGAARLDAGGRRFAGALARDACGEPVALTAGVSGSTVLLKYPNDPDGVIVRVAWQ